MSQSLTFHTEPTPERGQALPVAPGIMRLVANNPGAFTYHGTNTYLLAGPAGFTVVDPGPEDEAHRAAILAATGGRIARILLTHTHPDHVDGLAALRGHIPVFAFATPQDRSITPDVKLHHGDAVGEWRALHTPGHASDHLCFARPDGVVLSGDHIMGWSSTIVSPPQGDMVAYFASLDRMLAEGGHTYLPGHGPAIPNPADYTRALKSHREAREAAILAALTAPKSLTDLTRAVYTGLAAHLLPAAERNVAAHLQKLAHEGRAAQHADLWRRVE